MATQKLELSPDVMFQEVQGELVMFDLASEKYYALTEVAARVWKLVGAGAGANQIIETLLQEYAVEPAQLETDVTNLLAQLKSAGLIKQNWQ